MPTLPVSNTACRADFVVVVEALLSLVVPEMGSSKPRKSPDEPAVAEIDTGLEWTLRPFPGPPAELVSSDVESSDSVLGCASSTSCLMQKNHNVKHHSRCNFAARKKSNGKGGWVRSNVPVSRSLRPLLQISVGLVVDFPAPR